MSFWWRFIRWLRELLDLPINPQPPRLQLEVGMARLTVSWTLPTERQGGIPLPIEQIAETVLTVSSDGGQTFSPEVGVPSDGPQEFQIDNIQPGTYLVRAVVVDTEGRRSDAAEAQNTLEATPPNAIADLTVVIE